MLASDLLASLSFKATSRVWQVCLISRSSSCSSSSSSCACISSCSSCCFAPDVLPPAALSVLWPRLFLLSLISTCMSDLLLSTSILGNLGVLRETENASLLPTKGSVQLQLCIGRFIEVVLCTYAHQKLGQSILPGRTKAHCTAIKV